MFLRVLKIVFRLVIGLVAALILFINVKLYLPAALPADVDTVPRHAEAQLSWIKGQLEKGSGAAMQAHFPEGYFFSYTLYGLSWVEMGLRDESLIDNALAEARWALQQIESKQGKAVFPAALPPDHGMFYSAWRNHLLSGIILLQPRGKENKAEFDLYQKRCSELAQTFRESPLNPFPASYIGQAWPCDSPPAIHSLCVYREVTGDGQFADVVERWVFDAKARLDPSTGLVPHQISPKNGALLDGSRGTSQSIILRFLPDIDAEFAADQYTKFRNQYYTQIAAVPAVREYPHGVNRGGDVDSGPLFFGASFSSTVVGMGVAQIYGDQAFADAISQTGEVIGWPAGRTQRKYLGGILPIGDTFLAHASTARPWLSEGEGISIEPYRQSIFWRWKIHLGSAVILCILVWAALGFRLRLFKKK